MRVIHGYELFTDVDYPAEFVSVLRRNLVDLSPWIILHGKELQLQREGLGRRYPSQSYVPFAMRLDRDDVACWDKSQAHGVLLVHDFASVGYEQMETHPDFWSWFRRAINEMITDFDYEL